MSTKDKVAESLARGNNNKQTAEASREAIAVTSLHTPFCMPGMTFVTAIFAVLRIPQRTLDKVRHHSRKDLGGKTCGGSEVGFGDCRPVSWELATPTCARRCDAVRL